MSNTLVYLVIILRLKTISSYLNLTSDDTNSPEDFLSEEEKIVRAYYTCSYDVCKGRGECYFNEMGKAACKCYAQYYQGPNCTIIPDLCDPATVADISWIPQCNKHNIYYCINTFAMSGCFCRNEYVGRTCNVPFQWKDFNYREHPYSFDFPISPIALFSLEPQVLKKWHIDFGVKLHKAVSFYEFGIEGISYRVEKEDFEKKSFYQLQAKEDITTLLGTEIIPQRYWKGIDHTVMIEGYQQVKFQSIFEYESYRAKNIIINTNPGGKNTFSADYIFQYHAIRKKELCIPVYRFSGGACSTTDSKSGYGTSYKSKIKLHYTIKNVCNKSYELKDDRVMVLSYKGGNNFSLIKDFDAKWNTQQIPKKDIPLTLLQLMKRVRDYANIYSFPALGDQFLIIGRITERVPPERVLGLDGQPRLVSEHGYGLCFIRYFKRAKISATIDGIGEYYYWAPHDHLLFNTSITTYDGDQVTDYGTSTFRPQVIYNKYIVTRKWTLQEAGDINTVYGRSFEMTCDRKYMENSTGNASKEIFYDTTTYKGFFENLIGLQVIEALQTAAYYVKTAIGWTFKNPFWDDDFDTCMDQACPWAQREYGGKIKGPVTSNGSSHFLNLTGPLVCQVYLDVCVIEVLEDNLQWFESYKQGKSWPRLSKNQDCIRHEFFAAVANFRLPADRPLMIIQCVHNCRMGNRYINWEIDPFDYSIIKYDLVKRPEKLIKMEWRWNDKQMPEENFFMKAKDLSVLFLYPHAFDELVDEFSMMNITAHVNDKGLQTNILFYVFIRNSIDSNTGYCQMLTPNGVSINTEFYFCEKKADPVDAQTILYAQKMNEYISERGVIITYGDDIKSPNNLLASSPLQPRIIFTIYHNVFRSEYSDTYWQDFTVAPPPTRFSGTIIHGDYLRDLVVGKLDDHTSLEFDAKVNNFFLMIQKVHIVVIETTHLSFTKYMEENTHILDTKMEIRDTFVNLIKLKMTTKYDVMQMTSILNEFIHVNALPTKSYECLAYSKLFASLSSAFAKIIPIDEAIREKPNAIMLILRPLIRIINGLTYPAFNELELKLDDPMAILIGSNTVDELISEDISWEFYPTYELDFEELKKVLYQYGNASYEVYNQIPNVLNFLNPVVQRRWASYFLAPFRIYTEGQSTVLIVATNTYKILLESLYRNYADMAVSLLETESNDTMESNFTLKILFCEHNFFWWHPSSKIAHNQMIFLDLVPLPDESPEIDEQDEETRRVEALHGLKAIYEKTHRRFMESDKSFNDTEKVLDKRVYIPVSGVQEQQTNVFYHLPPITYWKSGVAYSLIDEESVLSYATKYITVAQKGLTGRLFVIFDPKIPSDINVLITIDTPTFLLFRIESQTVGPEAGVFVIHYDLPNNNMDSTPVNIMIAPNKTDATPFYMHVITADCVVWGKIADEDNNTEMQWASAKKMNICESPTMVQEYTEDMPNYGALCKCNFTKNVAYSTIFTRPQPHLHGFLVIEIEFEMANLLILPSFSGLFCLLFFFLFAFCNFFDSKDTRKVVPIYCVSNRPRERYEYVLVIVTACNPKSGTTSHVGIKIYGTFANSKRHVLFGVEGLKRKQLQRRNVDWFVLTTDDPLGNIRAVEMWIDNRGSKPSCVVPDATTRNKFIDTVL